MKMKKRLNTLSRLMLLLGLLAGCEDNSSSPSATGTGGSTARFTIAQNHLYTVDNKKIKVFDLANSERPVLVNEKTLGFGVETIFPYQDKLFIGTQTGMQILDAVDPTDPVHLSTFEHVLSCDPVVADSQHAFVTLRTANNCRNGEDRLDVLDISDLTNPELIYSRRMFNPHGLGLDDSTLFVCDGANGLLVYNVSNREQPLEIGHVPDIETFDVIPFDQLLMVIGRDGLYQFDYSDPTNLQLYSKIEVVQ